MSRIARSAATIGALAMIVGASYSTRAFADPDVEAAKALARTILDGDPSALAVLADALEEAGDPRAAVVRGWLEPVKPARRRRTKRP